MRFISKYNNARVRCVFRFVMRFDIAVLCEIAGAFLQSSRVVGRRAISFYAGEFFGIIKAPVCCGLLL